MSYYGPDRNDRRSISAWVWFAALMVALLIVLGFALDWFAAPLRVMSPSNMEQLSREANDSWEALKAARANVDAQKRKANDFKMLYGEDQSKWPQGKADEYLQIQQQITNLTTAYNGACGQYQAMWKDKWRDYPAPDDLPTTCEMIQ